MRMHRHIQILGTLSCLLVVPHLGVAQGNCLATDDTASRFVASIQKLVDTASISGTKMRSKIGLPAANPITVTLVTTDSLCQRVRKTWSLSPASRK